MIKKLLIANRGEIACRIMRTAHRMGIVTVGVYSDADENALHVRNADQSVSIGPASALESYLNIDAILEAAKQTGADSIHPGYGFLAESAAFAEAVRKAGLIFVGPPTAAIHAMGAKDNAKALMAEADVPLVPGYYGSDQTVACLVREAKKIGYPILLKAVMGGGGKGMRIVHSDAELKPAIEGAKREAASSFGDDRLLIETYLADTRHVEMQVFADCDGNTVHLFERDCSLQRRHQKVIEEAPAPGMSESLRRKMGASAIAAAKTVGYEGAGTVEFLLSPDGRYFFMEMNTRLQVEHPVSELITGLDFVEWQLRIASGEKLPLSQDQIKLRGHAVEARLYAEDPTKDFLPAPGTIDHLQWPKQSDKLRIDAGVEAGDVISAHYDPMIAKVIGYGESRSEAISQLINALGQTEIVGPGVNIGFLIHLLRSEPFEEGQANTSYVDGLSASSYAISEAEKNKALATAAQHFFSEMDRLDKTRLNASQDPYTPWSSNSGWRLAGNVSRQLTLVLNEERYLVVEKARPDGFGVEIDGRIIDIDLNSTLKVLEVSGVAHMFGPEGPVSIKKYDPLQTGAASGTGGNPFSAPMPGKITLVNISVGDLVREGDSLIVLEAMKMEHAIIAPFDGVVEDVFVSTDQLVDEGVELLAMGPIK